MIATPADQPRAPTPANARLPIAVNTFPLVHRTRADQAIRRLSALGHHRFEIACAPTHLWPSEVGSVERRRLRAEWQSAGFEVVSINPSSLDQNLAGAAPETRDHTLKLLRAVLELAADLEIANVVVAGGRVNPLLPPPRELVRGWLRDGLTRAVEHARATGVRILLENIPFGAVPLADDLVSAVDEIDDPALGIAYDVANATFVGERPEAGIRAIGHRLALVHLADTGLNSWRHDPMGRGVVVFDRVASALRETGFEGPSVIEVMSVVPETDLAVCHQALAAAGWEPPPFEIRPSDRPGGVEDRTQIRG